MAGTGKTSLITYFLSLPILNNMKIAVTGCTNKAVGVLESLYLKKKKFLDRHEENIIQDKNLWRLINIKFWLIFVCDVGW